MSCIEEGQHSEWEWLKQGDNQDGRELQHLPLEREAEGTGLAQPEGDQIWET